jgi:hypothetical protein
LRRPLIKLNIKPFWKFSNIRVFGQKWVGWIKEILGTATSSVLLNGVLGKVLNCKRGVMQGDPLSPLLFVLAADLLQSVINRAKD